jgi:alkylation response protein AidB-like acyl-CoA dehydrogenase
MDFQLSAEQRLMRDSTHEMVKRDIEPILARNDANRALPKSDVLRIFKTLAAQGLTAPRLPEAAGGPGLKMLDYGIMFEQLPCSVAMAIMAHEGCVTRLNAECNEEQKKRFLPDLIAANIIGCTGTTEPDSGSDLRAIKTRLTRGAGKLVLNGRKLWISNASVCDVMIVTCIEQGLPSGRPEFRKVIVDRRESPFEAHEIDMIGLKQGYLGEVTFDGIVVAEENLIVSTDDATRSLSSSWNVNRALVALQAVNLAQLSFDAALEYAKIRRQFGKPIAGHQLIQSTLSQMATIIEACRLLAYRALDAIDHGDTGHGNSAMAKRFAQTECGRVIWEAMNVLGSMGLSSEAKLEGYYRDVRMLATPDGTNEILALIHGRELTGLSAFRDRTHS